LTVGDLQNRRDLILVTDSQDVRAILDILGIEGDYDFLLVKEVGGEIVEAYGGEGVPYVWKPVDILIHPKGIGLAQI